jgi:hypothetical protein
MENENIKNKDLSERVEELETKVEDIEKEISVIKLLMEGHSAQIQGLILTLKDTLEELQFVNKVLSEKNEENNNENF